MAINFPVNPSLNDEFMHAGKTFVWNGAKWKLSYRVNYKAFDLVVSYLDASDRVSPEWVKTEGQTISSGVYPILESQYSDSSGDLNIPRLLYSDLISSQVEEGIVYMNTGEDI